MKDRLYFMIPRISEEYDLSETLPLDALYCNDIAIRFEEEDKHPYYICAEFDGRVCSIDVVDMVYGDTIMFIYMDIKSKSTNVTTDGYILPYTAEQFVYTLTSVVRKFIKDPKGFTIVYDHEQAFYAI